MMDNLVALLLGRAGAAGGPAERDAVSTARTTTEAKAVTVEPWLSVAIPAGAVFGVMLEDPDGAIASGAVNFRYYEDGSESQSTLANNVTANAWHYYTAAADIANLTVYQPAASVVDSGDIRLKAKVYTEATGLSTAIAPTMPPVATSNLAAGDLVMQGASLYMATQAIVAGAEITPGTNAQKTTVADWITQTVYNPTTTASFLNTSSFNNSAVWVKFGKIVMFYCILNVSTLPGSRVNAVSTVPDAFKPAANTSFFVERAEGGGSTAELFLSENDIKLVKDGNMTDTGRYYYCGFYMIA